MLLRRMSAAPSTGSSAQPDGQGNLLVKITIEAIKKQNPAHRNGFLKLCNDGKSLPARKTKPPKHNSQARVGSR